jgi:vacuolar-type H+-ATPase subunit H
VPQLRDFLSRFRPAGAPGAAAVAGVPADRARDLEAELVPVLALLADVDADCARVVEQARRDADDIVAAARGQAAERLREAGLRAAAAREDIMRQAMAAARHEAADTVTRARQQAEQTRQSAGQRMPALAGRAADLVRGLAAGESDPSGGPGQEREPGWPR